MCVDIEGERDLSIKLSLLSFSIAVTIVIIILLSLFWDGSCFERMSSLRYCCYKIPVYIMFLSVLENIVENICYKKDKY